MKFAICPKCGKRKLASVNRDVDELTCKDTEMIFMGYGKFRNMFVCRNCKEDSKFFCSNEDTLLGYVSKEMEK